MNTTHKMYSEIEVNTEIMTATRHRQVQLLMDKCLQHMETAKFCIINKDISKKHQTIIKALDIINYLRLCLNFKNQQTRELSEQLDALYTFMASNLLKANLKNDIEYIDQARNALTTIKGGWDEVDK